MGRQTTTFCGPQESSTSGSEVRVGEKELRYRLKEEAVSQLPFQRASAPPRRDTGYLAAPQFSVLVAGWVY